MTALRTPRTHVHQVTDIPPLPHVGQLTDAHKIRPRVEDPDFERRDRVRRAKY